MNFNILQWSSSRFYIQTIRRIKLLKYCISSEMTRKIIRGAKRTQILQQILSMKKKILYREGEINVRHRCGCYLRRYPRVQDQTQMSMLPLRSIDYHMEVVNSLVNITMVQKYYNPADKYLEIDYLLPINVDSSIYKFEVEFGTVKIQGIIKEQKQAKKQFQQAKSEGRQAALGTVDQNKDVLKLEIGNIPPHTEFTVTVCLLQELKISQSTFYHLQIPAIISPRSMAKDPYNWTFKLDLKTSRKVTFFNSVSHKMTMISQNEQCTETLLVMQKSQVPNKEFSFVYTTENFHIPSCVIGNTDASSTVLLSFIPKFCELQATDAYKALLENKSQEVDISTVKGEYIFFLDRSHSMGGKRLIKAKQSLIIFLKSIPENSYFNIISFGGRFEPMFQQSRKYSTQAANRAIKQVQQMKANMGGTQILLPLQQCLRKSVIYEYPRHIYLLTDGGVQDTQQVLKTVKNNTSYSRVHSIGIGDGASKQLIEGCANRGKGKFVMVSDEENPTQKIIQLLESSLSSLISKVNLKYDDRQIEAIVPNPKSIPYILKDNPANFYIKYKGPLTQKKQFVFEYEDPLNKQLYSTSIKIDPTTDSNFSFVEKLGAMKVLEKLENAANNRGDINQTMYYQRQSAKQMHLSKYHQQEAINYSIRHQILSQFTAFICVGKELVDGQYQEWKNTGSGHVVVPSIINQNLNKSRKRQAPLCAARAKVMMKKSKCINDLMFQRSRGRGRGGHHEINTLHYNKFGDFDDPDRNNQYLIQQCQSVQEDDDQDFGENQSFSREQPCKMFKRGRPMDKSRSKSRQNQRQKSNKRQKQSMHEPTNLLDSIIRSQQANGSWKSPHILSQLLKNTSVSSVLSGSIAQQIIITKVVLLWLIKHHNTKELSLIIKKANAWFNSAIKKLNLDEKKFSGIQVI